MNSWVEEGDALYAREHDTDGRVKRIVLDGSGSPAGSEIVDYTYDPAGRITRQTQTGQPDRTYGYDASDRLVYYKAGSLVQSWTYDEPTGLGDGNRTTQKTAQDSSLITVASSYAPASNRLTQRTDGTATVVSTYDAAGNTLTDGAVSYLYGANGRLAKATAGGVDTNYLYNGLGQRVRKSGALVVGSAVNFLYDGSRLLGEYDASGAAIQETVWLGDLPVMVLKTNTHYFVNPDHLGAPRSVAFANGRALWTWDHDPFGVTQPNQNPNGFGNFVYNLRFPGQYYDSETGLHYDMARDYDPATGRYIQSDPIGLAGGINTYGYVGGEPVNSIDPTGTLQDNSDSIPTITIYPLSRQTSNRIAETAGAKGDFFSSCDAHEFCKYTVGSFIIGLSTVSSLCRKTFDWIGQNRLNAVPAQTLKFVGAGEARVGGHLLEQTRRTVETTQTIMNLNYPNIPYSPDAFTIEQNAKNAHTITSFPPPQ